MLDWRQRHSRQATAAAAARLLLVLPLLASSTLCLTTAAICRLPAARLQAVRDHSKILMGKNTMMRRSIRLYCERTGNDQWLQLLDHMIGNVGLIFTKGDLNEVRAHAPGRGPGAAFEADMHRSAGNAMSRVRMLSPTAGGQPAASRPRTARGARVLAWEHRWQCADEPPIGR